MSRKLPRATTQTLADVSGAQTVAAEPPPSSETNNADLHPNLHRAQAQAIVDRHTTLSAIGGIVPIPLADTISLMVIVSRMVGALARHYGVPSRPERLRTITAAVIGGVAPPVLSGITVSGLARLVPGAYLFGAALSSTAAAGLTRALGQAFILHFEAGGTVLDFDPDSVVEHQRTATA